MKTSSTNGKLEPSIIIEISFRNLQLIRNCFLPANPNKLRTSTPEVRQAAKDFIEVYEREVAKRALSDIQPARTSPGERDKP